MILSYLMGKYIKECTVCGRRLLTDNPLQQKHKNCKAPKHRYPRKFYYQRPYVYERDKFRCQNCGKKVTNEKRNPPVHHIDGDPMNNSLENLVTLCEVCHQKIHRGEDFVSYGKIKFAKIKKYKPKRQKYHEVKPKEKPLLFKGV